ncbi:MAG: HAD family hydrolase [SAR324 cluster bacterium]|uniref:HAD family hydrolase n=1 Tax=SAR324 cluster bacterium TaxID=2024889 RepID=A0A7X9IJB1_9DELT|nr:HAD family hydrolase [SAR324 cluster bacterium]
MALKLIISDFDGVIADSLNMYKEAYKQTFAHFGKATPFSNFKEWYNSEWEKNWTSSGFAHSEIPAVCEIFSRFINYDLVDPFKGMEEELSKLNSIGPVVIASTTCSSIINQFLQRTNLAAFVEEVYSPDGGSDKKGIISKAIDARSLSPQETLMIGDTPSDIKPANELGCLSIAVTYGWYNKENLLSTNPTYIVESVQDLFKAANLLSANIK